MPIVPVYYKGKADDPAVLQKLHDGLPEILARMLSIPGAELKKESIKLRFLQGSPYDTGDEDVFIHPCADIVRKNNIKRRVEQAEKEIRDLLAPSPRSDRESVHGIVYPFLGSGEVGRF
jgi:hypothetical protein